MGRCTASVILPQANLAKTTFQVLGEDVAAEGQVWVFMLPLEHKM